MLEGFNDVCLQEVFAFLEGFSKQSVSWRYLHCWGGLVIRLSPGGVFVAGGVCKHVYILEVFAEELSVPPVFWGCLDCWSGLVASLSSRGV